MKKLLVVMVALLSVTACVNAEEEAPTQDMGVTIDLTYTSKYIWRGFDILDDKSAWQPSINFDLGGGFSANVWASYAGGSGTTETGASRVNLTEYNYTLAYDGSVLEDSALKTNYQFGWRYYDYIDTASKDNDVQEVFLTGSMPALTGCGVVPHFGIFQMWEAKQGASKNTTTQMITLVPYGMGTATPTATAAPSATAMPTPTPLPPTPAPTPTTAPTQTPTSRPRDKPTLAPTYTPRPTRVAPSRARNGTPWLGWAIGLAAGCALGLAGGGYLVIRQAGRRKR